MKKFLEKVAKIILQKSQQELLTTAVIFPNKRSEVFLKDHLKNKTSKNIWLPEMYSIDEFMVKASGMQQIDPIQTYFELFDIHKKIAGTDARPIEDFLSWAPIMMADFNDIDMYMADAEKIFSHLSEIRAIQEWNLDQKPLTDMQVNYLAFYNSLIDYYKNLKVSLKKNGIGYNGMIYRHLAENINELSKKWPWKQFIVVGFNALTEAEQLVFDHFYKNYKTNFYWDIDEYYFTDEGKMEAGQFISKMLKRWPGDEINWVENNLLTAKKEITLVGIPKRIGQVKFAGQELESIVTSQKNPPGDESIDTALVLAEENLLTPLLNSLPILSSPGKNVGYNITMGYPVYSTPFSRFITDWLELLVLQNENKNQLFSTQHFIALLNNPIYSIIVNTSKNDEASAFRQKLRSNTYPFFSKDEITSQIPKNNKQPWVELINHLVSPGSSPLGFINSLTAFLQISKEAVDILGQEQFLFKEQLILMLTMTKNLSHLVEKNKEIISLKALLKIFVQLIRRSEINLKGEPLSGIQIMGMLETRNLDFKNLIILSANEGILPKTDSMDSFIPFDLRSQFNLPLPKDKTDVFAYHFFRLLQRAENITLIYNSQPDALGGGEKSRFILQLQEELAKANPDILISEKQIVLPPPEIQSDLSITIPKDQEVQLMIHEKIENGLSPSSLATYINCSLQFYFSQLLKLKQPDSFEQNIESDVFGNIIHGVLEEIYKPFIGQELKPEFLKKNTGNINYILSRQFDEHYEGGDLKSGKNLLIVEVAKKYIERFIKSNIDYLKTHKTKLIAVEEMLSTKIEIASRIIKLKGKIDRIDYDVESNTIFLADYKTGGVVAKDLELKEWDSLLSDPKYAKTFQLLFYSFLFKTDHAAKGKIEAGIYSLRKPSGGFIQPSLPDDANIIDSMEIFEIYLKKLIGDLLNTEIPFAQTENEDNCNWCDFKNICNRVGKSSF